MRQLTAVLAAFVLLGSSLLHAQDDAKQAPDVIKLSDGKISLPVPAKWERKKPRTRIVEHEFAAVAAAEDGKPARVTVMGAGGGVEANISRWIGQFTQPDGSATREKTKTDKSEVAGAQVYVVDITGTYQDRPGGPFAGGRVVPRANYRMLGGIIVTKNSGHYFVKVIGDAATVEAHAKPFREMLKKLEIK